MNLFLYLQHSARSHPFVYESIKGLRMEQNATLITGEKLQAGQLKLRRRVKYEQLDEQSQQLVSSFHLTAREIYFKRARALQILIFSVVYFNKLILFSILEAQLSGAQQSVSVYRVFRDLSEIG